MSEPCSQPLNRRNRAGIQRANAIARDVSASLHENLPSFEARKGEPVTPGEADCLFHIAQIAGLQASNALQALIEFGEIKGAPLDESEMRAFLTVARAVRDTMVTSAFRAIISESRETGSALTPAQIEDRKRLFSGVSRACASPETFHPVTSYLRERGRKNSDDPATVEGIQTAVICLSAGTGESASAALRFVSVSEEQKGAPLSQPELEKLFRPLKIISDNSPSESVFDALGLYVKEKAAPLTDDELDWMSRVSREAKNEAGEAVTAFTALRHHKQMDFSEYERAAFLEIAGTSGAAGISALAALGEVKNAGFTKAETVFFVDLAVELARTAAERYEALAEYVKKRGAWLTDDDLYILRALALRKISD